MRRALGRWALVFGLAFALVALMRWSWSPQDHSTDPVPAVDQSSLREFWEFYTDATAHRSRQSHEEAARLYRRALTLKPGHEDSLYYLANSLLELGEYAHAVSTYRRLLEANPESLRGLSQLGTVLATPFPGGATDYSEAERLFERTVQLSPEESGPFLRLGRLALNRQEPERALHSLETAAGFGSLEGAFWTGYVLYRLNRHREAIGWFARVLRASAREQALEARGARLEGDAGPNEPELTPVGKTSVKARLFLHWSARRLGGYPDDVPVAFRLPAVEPPTRPYSVLSSGLPADIRGRGRWADYDGDGRPDLAVAGPEGVRLFHNQDRTLRETTLLRSPDAIWDIAWGDYDGDGDADLYAVGWPFATGQSRLWENRTGADEGTGATFAEVTTAVGLGGERRTLQAIWFDYDLDGLQDLLEVGGGPGDSLRLYHNKGAGGFDDRSRQAGLELMGTAVRVALADVDGDRLIDVLVLRWRRDGILFRNRGDGTFEEFTAAAGLEGIRGNSLSAVFADINNDGSPDLLVVPYAPTEIALGSLLSGGAVGPFSPRLFENSGDGRFVETSSRRGLKGGSGTMEALAVDLDADGWTDFLLATGGWDSTRLEPSRALLNQGGQRFQQVLVPDLNSPVNSPGAAAADLDGDGRPEFYLAGVGILGSGTTTPMRDRRP